LISAVPQICLHLQKLNPASILSPKPLWLKILVKQRLLRKTMYHLESSNWLSLQVHFLDTTLKPLIIRMHASSPAINVKRQIRELFHVPYLAFSLHSADGELLPDDLPLRDLRIHDDGRLYCRICTDAPAAAADVVQDEHAAAAVRVLIRQMEAGPLPSCTSASTGSKRRRESEDERKNLDGGRGPDGRRTGFLGMRRGFLLASPAAARVASETNTAPVDALSTTARAAGEGAPADQAAPARQARQPQHRCSSVHLDPC
jgi:hypothetical protein